MVEESVELYYIYMYIYIFIFNCRYHSWSRIKEELYSEQGQVVSRPHEAYVVESVQLYIVYMYI